MDVAVIGAGPVGLMLAAELRLGGAEVVVLDRRATPDERPRANGLGGRIVEQLDHRGLLDRFRAEAAFAGPLPGFPFGPVPLNFAGLDTPMRGLMLQQPRMEALLAARATELGAEIRRGHELVDLDTVRGPDGSYRLEAQYVVGCDGAHSRVRELAGIGFPGTTDNELMRLGHFRAGPLPLHDDGRARAGWNRRPGGRVLVTSLTPGVVIAGVREVAPEPPGEPTLERVPRRRPAGARRRPAAGRAALAVADGQLGPARRAVPRRARAAGRRRRAPLPGRRLVAQRRAARRGQPRLEARRRRARGRS